MERRPCTSVLTYLPQTCGITESPEGESVVGVSIHFSLETFRGLFKELPQCLKHIDSDRFESSVNQWFYQQSQFNSDTFFVLKQIIECPYQGEVRRLFLEAKSLELVALKLNEIGQDQQHISQLGCKELERIHEAYHILLQRLAYPPSLENLSRTVGINRNKLNQGFKQLYGETVFNILRNLRLKKAWTLLDQTRLSLSEIAFSVGYNNQANFTTAFRKYFGQTPKAVRQKLVK